MVTYTSSVTATAQSCVEVLFFFHIPQNGSVKNIFEKCKLINDVDVTATLEFKQLKLYGQKEISDVEQFSAKNENQFATNDSLNKFLFKR